MTKDLKANINEQKEKSKLKQQQKRKNTNDWTLRTIKCHFWPHYITYYQFVGSISLKKETLNRFVHIYSFDAFAFHCSLSTQLIATHEFRFQCVLHQTVFFIFSIAFTTTHYQCNVIIDIVLFVRLKIPGQIFSGYVCQWNVMRWSFNRLLTESITNWEITKWWLIDFDPQLTHSSCCHIKKIIIID